MFPWLWFWAPKIDFPLSGNVSQDFMTDWFFSGIQSRAGDGKVEQKIFNQFSYGKQLGVIAEVLLSVAEKGYINQDQATKALQQLKEIHSEATAIKNDECIALREQAVTSLNKLKEKDPLELHKILNDFANLPAPV